MKTLYQKVFWAAGFGWLFDAMDVGLLSFILVPLAEEWSLSPSSAGWLGTLNLFGMAIGASLGGYLADAYGRKPVFLSTLALFGAASVASAFAWSFPVMLVLRFIMGLGLGAELPVASTLVNEFAPATKRARTVVLLESFWAVGWIAAAAISYFIIPAFGWRTAVIIGALPLLYALAIRKVVPESPKYHKKEQRVPIHELFSKHARQTIMLWSVWFAVTFSYYGMFLWLPSVLVGKGFPMIQSFGYVLLMNLAQLPGYFAAARLVETWGRKKTLAAFLLMTAVSAFLFGSSGTVSTLLLSGALLNFFNLGAWGALYAYTPENYPVEIRASGAGFASAFGRIGSMIAPVFMGVLVAHRFSYGAIFAIYTAVLISGALVLMLAGTETKQETITT